MPRRSSSPTAGSHRAAEDDRSADKPQHSGASTSDAFDVVIPLGAGYGFSGKPTAPGWDPARMARAWTVLMKRLGYTHFVTQGGDCVYTKYDSPWLPKWPF
jgi:hypothetical protein